jgi:hypothetical protein
LTAALAVIEQLAESAHEAEAAFAGTIHVQRTVLRVVVTRPSCVREVSLVATSSHD